MIPVLLWFLFQAAPLMDLPNVTENPYAAAADIALGQKLYKGRCAGCHGLTGDGGKGANLAVRDLPRAQTEQALYRVVRYGIPETEMPATLMAPREVWQIAAFVRSLGSASQDATRGNAAAGEQVVSAKGGCLQCHAIGLKGGRMGPALSDIGGKRSPGHLRGKLLDPAADLVDTFRLATVTTKDGRKITGVRLNEDPFSIQIRDFSDGIHSFFKEQLASVHVERRTTMPSYKGRLSAAEIEDVVAYLLTLRGNVQ
ncbi:MAG: c-type cytochrome [Bryobacterales bacterium]|nr:c-type cytochrome [Bryobacterales bacterium]